MEYRENGILLKDALTPWGWTISDSNELLTALEGFKALETVPEGFIIHAIGEALKDRQEYDNIADLVSFLVTDYI